jgi:hypothetical protein
MELQPADSSLRAKYQRNVVAAFVSTDTRWIGFSEDDVRKAPKAQISGGEAADFANALRTTRSTLPILSDDAASLHLA